MTESNSTRMLIADDDKNLVDVFTMRCQTVGVEVIEAYDAESAFYMIQTCRPDVLCFDVHMPPDGGLNVCQHLRSMSEYESIPVIILTGMEDDETIRRCQELNATYVKKGPEAWNQIKTFLQENVQADLEPSPSADRNNSTETNSETTPTTLPELEPSAPVHEKTETGTSDEPLLDAVFAALGIDETPAEWNPLATGNTHPSSSVAQTGDRGEQASTETSTPELPTPKMRLPASEPEAQAEITPWVLHVDDDPDMGELVRLRLAQFGIKVVSASDASTGIRKALCESAAAIILDFHMPNGRGDYVLRRLKENELTKEIPVFVLSGAQDRFIERRLIGMGAAGFFHKPPSFEDLAAQLTPYIEIEENKNRSVQPTVSAAGM